MVLNTYVVISFRAAHETWKDSIKIYECVDISPIMNQAAEYILRGIRKFMLTFSAMQPQLYSNY